jgi:hypothetical protein
MAADHQDRPRPLAGDIAVERANFSLYIPLATSLIISVALSILFKLLNR